MFHELFDRVRYLIASIGSFLKKLFAKEARPDDVSYAGVCPYCALLTPRNQRRCLECGKLLYPT